MKLVHNTEMFLGRVEYDTQRDTPVVASSLASLQIVMDHAAAGGAAVVPVSRWVISKFREANQAAQDCVINIREKHIS